MKTTIEDTFLAQIEQLEMDAKAAGSNMTEVCRVAGVSRTTPDRWKARPPGTIATLARLQRVVAQKLEQQQQETPPVAA